MRYFIAHYLILFLYIDDTYRAHTHTNMHKHIHTRIHACIGIPAFKSEIWFIDRSLRWFPLADGFVDYYRLAVMHLGLPQWQYRFTDVGLSPQTMVSLLRGGGGEVGGHLGLPQWQYRFTDVGLSPQTMVSLLRGVGWWGGGASGSASVAV